MGLINIELDLEKPIIKFKEIPIEFPHIILTYKNIFGKIRKIEVYPINAIGYYENDILLKYEIKFSDIIGKLVSDNVSKQIVNVITIYNFNSKTILK